MAEPVSETDTQVKVKNPSVVNIQTTPEGRMTLQVYPLFFSEFLADKTQPTYWSYNKAQITQCEQIALDYRFEMQYKQLFAAQGAPDFVAPKSTEPKVVKLFDAEEN